ncbi:MAG: TRAP transporter fused permease subunit [Alphaproteobacteria bacterium]|nr:TRAP transporter fused permease subunit [Alphaproteobacteria bacterium]
MNDKAGKLAILITPLAVGMSLYHLYIAYTGGYEPNFQRALSYFFGLALIFLVYRDSQQSPVGWVITALLFGLAIVSIGYPVVMNDYVLDRLYYVDSLRLEDIVLGCVAIALTLEAARRTINNALPIIVLFFLVYTLLGPYFPWEFGHRGASFIRTVEHHYLTPDGLWTVPLGVFSTFIFLFILFGAFLDKMGAADYYIRLSVAAAGRLRGGPAKAAIFASAMTGSITGSANANIATTGPFTIPMMKKSGFKPEVAAGVETAASTGGQIMPPIMGASAFLIVEFTGISYWEVVKVSVLPAALYFLSVYTIVHLEARKEGLEGIPADQLEKVWTVLKEGWYFLVPPILIIVILMRGQSVPYAGLMGIASVIVLGGLKGTVDTIKVARTDGITGVEIARILLRGVKNVIGAMEQGAIRSLPIVAAVAAVGIIMGALWQTGLALKFSSLVVSLAGDNLFLAIILVGVASFVLGMGLPTSAAYIVLSVMAVPALLQIGEPWALSLLAAHLIVFWFSLDSSFTPPVCVPAYTAAGIAEANPSKAAWAAFRTAKGMYIIPVMFAFTPLLWLDQPLAVAQTVGFAIPGFLALAALIVGFMYVPLSRTDRILLAVLSAAMFWPSIFTQAIGLVAYLGFFWNQRTRYAKETSLKALALSESSAD